MTQLEIKNILDELKTNGCITGYRFYEKEYEPERSFEISYQDYHCGMSYQCYPNLEIAKDEIEAEAVYLKNLVEGRGLFNLGWNALSEEELKAIRGALWDSDQLRGKSPYENKIAEKLYKINIWKRRLFLDGKAS